MRRMRFLKPALALSCSFLAMGALAQTSAPHPVTDHGKPLPENGNKLASPAADASVQLAGSTITIHYNQPSVRSRAIFGGLVPYDQPWRTGANAATSLHTAIALKVGSLQVPAGDYTLYSLPEQGKPWVLIVNKQTGQWGTVYKPETDLGRTLLKSAPQTSSQEVMTI